MDPGSLNSFEQPVIEVSERLALRPWREEDAPAVRAAFDCPDIQRWHVRRMDSDGEARDWITGWNHYWIAERNASWAIVSKEDDQPLGQAGLRTISLWEGTAHVSYWVLPGARGNGVAVQAVRALTRWAFGTIGFQRLVLSHSTENLASCQVAGKAGFRHEGTLLGSMLHADGWHDGHLHALLRTELSTPASPS